MANIPVSVLVVTKNAAANIGRCLSTLKDFDEIVVIDSHSSDGTADIARAAGVTVAGFAWDGAYPKKRQWCLENLALRHDWIFFVDADEDVTPELCREIRKVFASPPDRAGYFVKGRYVVGGKVMKRGFCNNKLALFDRRRFRFPVVNDLGLPGMGEVEGHYQPVPAEQGAITGQLESFLLHYACGDMNAWNERHERYARWEAGMRRRQAWPKDPVRWRQVLKKLLRNNPALPEIAFVHSYILKGGFVEGGEGLFLSRTRWKYYAAVRRLMRSGG